MTVPRTTEAAFRHQPLLVSLHYVTDVHPFQGTKTCRDWDTDCTGPRHGADHNMPWPQHVSALELKSWSSASGHSPWLKSLLLLIRANLILLSFSPPYLPASSIYFLLTHLFSFLVISLSYIMAVSLVLKLSPPNVKLFTGYQLAKPSKFIHPCGMSSRVKGWLH